MRRPPQPQPLPIYFVPRPIPWWRRRVVTRTAPLAAALLLLGGWAAFGPRPSAPVLTLPASVAPAEQSETHAAPIADDQSAVLAAADAALVRLDGRLEAKAGACNEIDQVDAAAAYETCSREYDAIAAAGDELSTCLESAKSLEQVDNCEASSRR